MKQMKFPPQEAGRMLSKESYADLSHIQPDRRMMESPQASYDGSVHESCQYRDDSNDVTMSEGRCDELDETYKVRHSKSFFKYISRVI